jgi:hypothetical protein
MSHLFSVVGSDVVVATPGTLQVLLPERRAIVVDLYP